MKWSRNYCLCPEPSGLNELYIPKQLAITLMQRNKGLLWQLMLLMVDNSMKGAQYMRYSTVHQCQRRASALHCGLFAPSSLMFILNCISPVITSAKNKWLAWQPEATTLSSGSSFIMLWLGVPHNTKNTAMIRLINHLRNHRHSLWILLIKVSLFVTGIPAQPVNTAV